MKTADLLKREHETILDFLQVLDSVCRHMESGSDVPAEDLSIILDFIDSFIAGYHQSREERIIFPAMENAGILNRNGPLGSLISQHHTMQGYVRLMKDALTHSPFHRDKFIKSAEDYTSLARSHIQRETGEVFPLADSKMEQSGFDKLAMELEQYDIAVAGPGRLDELYRIPGLLKSEYQ